MLRPARLLAWLCWAAAAVSACRSTTLSVHQDSRALLPVPTSHGRGGAVERGDRLRVRLRAFKPWVSAASRQQYADLDQMALALIRRGRANQVCERNRQVVTTNADVDTPQCGWTSAGAVVCSCEVSERSIRGDAASDGVLPIAVAQGACPLLLPLASEEGVVELFRLARPMAQVGRAAGASTPLAGIASSSSVPRAFAALSSH